MSLTLLFITVPVIEMITGSGQQQDVTYVTTDGTTEQTIVHEVHDSDLSDSQTIIIGKLTTPPPTSLTVYLCVSQDVVVWRWLRLMK